MTLPPHTQELPLLLVDDNPQNLRLANFLLRSDGFSVWNADSAEQAIVLLKGQRFSMVLMDIPLTGKTSSSWHLPLTHCRATKCA